LSIDNVSIQEGGDERTPEAVFTVTLSAPSSNPVSVTVSTLNSAGSREGTARDSGARDYGRHTELLTFAPGVTSLPFVVTIFNDRVVERPRIEDFTVFLRDATGATIDRARGRGSIIDDDGPRPGSGGGGALDVWLLAMLGLCVFGAMMVRTGGPALSKRAEPPRAQLGPLPDGQFPFPQCKTMRRIRKHVQFRCATLG
jgi:hypothetical protein